MKKYAVVKNGKIVNLIEADEDFTLDGFDLIEETEATGQAHISGTFKNGVFVMPVYVPADSGADLEARIAAPSLGQS